MITAQELRIGNYLLATYKPSGEMGTQKTQYYPVDLKTLNSIFNGLATYMIYEGIPISPEILEKCGFESIKDKENVYRMDEYQIYLGVYNSLFYIKYDNKSYAYITGELKYLHQLQNLYFAITQQELNIQL